MAIRPKLQGQIDRLGAGIANTDIALEFSVGMFVDFDFGLQRFRIQIQQAGFGKVIVDVRRGNAVIGQR